MLDTHLNSIKIFCDSDNPNAIGSDAMRKTFNLSKPIIIPPTSSVKMMIGVEACSIPMSFYTFNERNNKFKYSDGTYNAIYNLPVGNYTIAQYTKKINNDATYPFKLEYDINLAKIRLTPKNESTNSFTITDTEDSVHLLLGIHGGATYTKDGGTGLFPHQPDTVNLVYTTGISIQLNNLPNDNDNLSPNTSSRRLVRIPIQTSVNSYLTYFNNQPFYSTISNKVVNMLDVSIVDDNGELLSTNGHHFFHITFRVDFTTEKLEKKEKSRIQKFREDTELFKTLTDEK